MAETQENKTEKLMKIKSQIDEAKSKQSEIKGQKNSIEAQIKSKYNIKINDIDSELDKMADSLDDKELIFQKGMDDLESGYDWL